MITGEQTSALRFSRIVFTMAAGLVFSIAVFQVILAFDADLSRSFGAPEEILDEPLLLFISGMVMGAVFLLLGVYALSGAGYIRVLPLLHPVLVTIGIVFIVRSLRIFIEPLVEAGNQSYPSEEIVSSIVALVTGLLFLAGWAALLRDSTIAKKTIE